VYALFSPSQVLSREAYRFNPDHFARKDRDLINKELTAITELGASSL